MRNLMTVLAIIFVASISYAQNGINVKNGNKSGQEILDNFDIESILVSAETKWLSSNNTVISQKDKESLNELFSDAGLNISVSNLKSIYGESRSCTAIDANNISMTHEAFYKADDSPRTVEEIEQKIMSAMFDVLQKRDEYFEIDKKSVIAGVYSPEVKKNPVNNVVISE